MSPMGWCLESVDNDVIKNGDSLKWETLSPFQCWFLFILDVSKDFISFSVLTENVFFNSVQFGVLAAFLLISAPLNKGWIRQLSHVLVQRTGWLSGPPLQV